MIATSGEVTTQSQIQLQGEVTGEITKIEPAAIAPGAPVQLRVTYNAFRAGTVFVWHTMLVGMTDTSVKATNTNTHTFGKGNRIDEPLNFPMVMPKRAINITVSLYGETTIYGPFGIPIPGSAPVLLDSKTITINLPTQMTPVFQLPPEETTLPPGAAKTSPWSLFTSFFPSTGEGEEAGGVKPVGTTAGIDNRLLIIGGIAIAATVGIVLWQARGRK